MTSVTDHDLCVVDSVPERTFREQLPKDLFKKRPLVFVAKIMVVVLIVSLAAFVAAGPNGVFLKLLSVVVLGVMYAHMVELQHELLHGYAFNGKFLNAAIGILMGLPMLSSYHGYKASHLRHHRDLGKSDNREFFSYKHKRLNGMASFARSAVSLHRYRDVAREFARALTGRRSKDAFNEREAKRIRLDYLIMLAAVVAGVAWSVLQESYALVYVWLLPLFIAEAVHFLIETPEHYGLDTQNNPNPLNNTRTIHTPSPFMTWLTNSNNL
ncbi:MAG TPA: fatty acid desaturase, partial [Arenibaculum sp.]|nr:fatty acid desaturase [Arenibaculum sp.]